MEDACAPLGLTPEQRETYDRLGVVRVPGAVSRPAAEAMADALWAELERRHGLDRRRSESWTLERPFRLQAVARSGAFAAMASPRVRAVLDEVLGDGWVEPRWWGLPLVAFPSPGDAWSPPDRDWHLDGQATTDPRVARPFVLLAPLDPGGGGTCCRVGSHHLVRDLAGEAGRPLPSREARARLADRLGGLEVIEMTGETGDLILMHPLVVHAPARNVRSTPRLVVTQWVEGRG
jgi:hypothetical protein